MIDWLTDQALAGGFSTHLLVGAVAGLVLGAMVDLLGQGR